MTPTVDSGERTSQRADLLALWRFTTDPAVRVAIELELYGAPDRQRARDESVQLAALAG